VGWRIIDSMKPIDIAGAKVQPMTARDSEDLYLKILIFLPGCVITKNADLGQFYIRDAGNGEVRWVLIPSSQWVYWRDKYDPTLTWRCKLGVNRQRRILNQYTRLKAGDGKVRIVAG
jgi:hypothetical protein